MKLFAEERGIVARTYSLSTPENLLMIQNQLCGWKRSTTARAVVDQAFVLAAIETGA
jgi:hypothetical protein